MKTFTQEDFILLSGLTPEQLEDVFKVSGSDNLLDANCWLSNMKAISEDKEAYRRARTEKEIWIEL